MAPHRTTTVAVVVCASALLAVVGMRADDVPKPSDHAEYNLAVQYAQASLDLANIELRKFLEENQRARGAVPGLVLDRARMNVHVAETQLAQVLSPSPTAKMSVHVRYAEERAKLAQLEYEKARELRNRRPDTFSELEIQRLKLVADTTRLRLAMWQNPVYLPSLLDQMQWQIDRLSEEIVEINRRFEKSEWIATPQ